MFPNILFMIVKTTSSPTLSLFLILADLLEKSEFNQITRQNKRPNWDGRQGKKENNRQLIIDNWQLIFHKFKKKKPREFHNEES